MGLDVMAGYVVRYGESLLYQGGNDDRPIHDASLGMNSDAVSTFQFTMPPTHPLRNSLQLHDFKNPVRVWFDGELLFTGFITRMVATMNMELVVNCVSDLQLLANVHARIEDHPQGNGNRRVYTARQLFVKMIDAYNEYMANWGDVEMGFEIGHNIGANEVGYYDSDAKKTVVDAAASTPTPILDILNSSILDPYNCMLRVWYSGETRYIGLYTAAPTTNSQVIKFGENMTEFAMDVNTDEMYNACLPVGGSRRTYKMKNAKELRTTRAHRAGYSAFYLRSLTGSSIKVSKGDILVIGDGEYQFRGNYTIATTGETETHIEGIKLEDLPNNTHGWYLARGTDYTQSMLTLDRLDDSDYAGGFFKDGEMVYHEASVLRYGLKSFTFSDSDTILTADLLEKAISEIKGKLSPTMTLSVMGVDMALYMKGYKHLVAGQRVRVVSAPHGVDTVMQVTQANLSLDNPSATRYTIGPVPKTATKRTKDARRDTADVRDMLTYDINNVITGAQIMGLR